MELVYLWVEEYKNIKNQGFNFSPRFECEFDGDNLTITENKDYVSIFPDNINVTAIVGENGSGKSSLLNYINSLERTNPRGIIIYQKDNQYFCFYEKQKPNLLKPTNLDIQLISSFDYTTNNNNFLNYNTIPISSSKDNQSKHIDNLDFIYLDGKVVPFSLGIYNTNYTYNLHENIFFVPRYISSVLNNDNILNNISSFLRFNRLRLILKPSSISSLKAYNKKLTMPKNISENDFFDKTRNIRNKIIDTLSNIEVLHQTQFTGKQKTDFGCFDLSLLIAFIEFYLVNTTNSGNDLQLYDTMNNKIFQLLENQKNEIVKGINEVKPDNANKFFINKWNKSKGYISAFFEELKQINELQIYLADSNFSIDEILETIKFYYLNWINENNFHGNQYIDIPINSELKENIKKIVILQKIFTDENMIINHKNGYLQVFDLDLYDSNMDIQYNEISDGEKQLIKYSIDFISVFNYYETRNNWNISISCIGDEIDNHLHPKWKQEIIYNFINMIKTYKKYREEIIPLHIILTTHSPFILSDLPKGNIIFLDKVDKKTKEKYPKLDLKDLKNGNCINVSNHIEIKTFGANIHTLLSDGFFMSDGLMGEFAKSKITEIKDFYDANKNLKKDDSNFESKKDEFEKNKKYFENIQKIIGEPFLQTIIKNYLDELEILFNGKKEFLDNEIKRLEELRNELK
jgi:energy-coupling factor transporter ATP-binding protein EcfA2